jgi:hypothetical protein
MSRRVALVKTDVLEERIASIIKPTRIGELGTTLAVNSNRSTLQGNTIILQIFPAEGLRSPCGSVSPECDKFPLESQELRSLQLLGIHLN